jgi:hypothetical protein
MTRDAVNGLLAHGLVLPTSAQIHGGERKVYRCQAPGCDAQFYEGEERQRVAHARSHFDDDAIRSADREHDSTYGEGDPEKLGWMKRRFTQTGSLNPRDY